MNPRPTPSQHQSVALPVAIALDVVAVVVFIALGRKTHAETGLAGFLTTVWPFLAALGLGWIGVGAAHTWAGWVATRVWPAGVVVWLTTTGAGLGIRALAGGGVSGGFPYVAMGVIGLLVLGWRAVAWLVWGRNRS